MDAMLKPGQKCDFTCWCHNRIDYYKTYYLVRTKDGILTACELCGSDYSQMCGWKRVCLYVKNGRPVNPNKTKIKRHG